MANQVIVEVETNSEDIMTMVPDQMTEDLEAKTIAPGHTTEDQEVTIEALTEITEETVKDDHLSRENQMKTLRIETGVIAKVEEMREIITLWRMSTSVKMKIISQMKMTMC